MTDQDAATARLKQQLIEARLRKLAKAEGRFPERITAQPANSGEGGAPLSSAQRRLWLLIQIDPAIAAAYHLTAGLRFDGDLDQAAARRALDAIVARQEILRARFDLVDGEPRQFARPADVGMPLRVLDLRAAEDDAAREARLDEIVRAEVARPLDIADELPVRACLVVLREGQWVLLFAIHHIAGDAESLVIFRREFETLYAAFRDGGSDPLAPLALQYRDFAAWQRDTAREGAQFWLDELAGAPVLSLPTRAPRPPQQPYAGTSVGVAIGAPLAAALRRLGQAEGVSVFTLLLAAFGILLCRLGDADDVVVGIASSSRQRHELDGLIGFFVDTLPIRIRAGGDRPLRSLIADVHQLVVRALDNRTVPLEKIVQDVCPQRLSSGNPLFQVMLSFEAASAGSFPDRDCSATSPIEMPQLASPFDLNCNLTDNGAEINGAIAFPLELFDPATVAHWSDAYVVLLEEMAAAEAATPIRGMAMIDGRERRRLIRAARGPEVPAGPAGDVVASFAAQAALCGPRTAVVCGEARLSYSELNAQANRLAAWLRLCGIGPDRLVAICADRSPAMIVGVLAVLKAGGAYVPFDPAAPVARLADMLDDCAPVVALLGGAGGRRLHKALAGRATAAFDLVADASLWAGLSSADEEVANLRPEHLAYVIYTSGSTGRPKGVMTARGSMARYLAWCAGRYARGGPVNAPLNTPLAFDAAVTSLFTPLLGGGAVHLVDEGREGLVALSSLLGDRGDLGLVKLTPGQLAGLAMLNTPPAAGRGETGRAYVVGGEALSARSAEPFRDAAGARVINEYGPTEATVGCVVHEVAPDTQRTGNIPIGVAIAGARVLVLDHALEPAAVGVRGEIHVGGCGLARGYLRRPGLTAERFVPDPFEPGARLYRTGDMARVRADGIIEYLGRDDQQVKIRGYRIELGEIEATLATYPGVAAAVVQPRTEADGETRLIAYVRAAPGAVPAPGALRTWLGRTLPDYMLPAAFMVLDAFPYTPNGKLDRRALPAPDRAAAAIAAFTPPHGAIETAVAVIWQDLLRVERVGRGDNFFTLGGHSMLAVRMIAALRERHLYIPIKALFATDDLAAFCAEASARGPDARHRRAPSNRIAAGATAIAPHDLPLVELSQDAIDRLVRATAGGAPNIQDIYPLGPLQEGMLYHNLIERVSDTYLSRHYATFETSRTLEAFLAALRHVVGRHDSLRTQFHWQNLQRPVQVVLRSVDLPVVEHRPVAGESAAALLDRVADSASLRIPLDAAPLVQVHVAADPGSSRRHLLLLLHHIVVDHLSLEIILREIEACLRGGVASLPVPGHYRDYVARCEAVALAEHEAYFRQLLGDVEEPTIPFGVRTLSGENEHTRSCLRAFPTAVAERVRTVVKRHRMSPAALFHVAWACVVAQCSGQRDVVFGTVVSGRLQDEGAGDYLVGLTVNTLPFRVVTEGRSPMELLQAVNRQLVALIDHEQTPLTMAQRCSPLPPHQPLFTGLFNYRQGFSAVADDAAADAWAGIDFLRADEYTNFPLCLSVNDEAGGGFFQVLWTSPAIDPERVADYMETAVRSFVEVLERAPHRPLLRIDVVPATERRRLAMAPNGAAISEPTLCLHEMFSHRAAARPEAVAVVCAGEALSYGELEARSAAVAGYLRGLGVGADDRVAICMERSVEMIVGLLAILKAGAGYVPLDPGYPADRLAFMLEDAAPGLVLTHAAARGALAAALAGLAAPPVVIDLDADAARWAGRAGGAPAAAARVAPHHLAYVIYTSGSTGRPKGVMIEHRNVVRLFAATAGTFAFGADDVWASFHSISFDFSVWEIWGALLHGGRLVIVPRAVSRSPGDFHALLRRERVTVLNQTPSAFRGLIAAREEAGGDHDVRVVVLGGEALEPAMLAPWFADPANAASRVVNMYGITETTVHVTHHQVTAEDVRVAGRSPIGRAIDDQQVHVLDRFLDPAPVGVAGEMYVGGAGNARGYVRRPGLTAARFVPHPFRPGERLYRTGDLARVRADGIIEYLGRNDQQVKIRGFRIETGEIEATMGELPTVREAVVVAAGDAPVERRLVAYYVPAEVGADEALRTAEWQGVFDDLYAPSAAGAFGADFRGWNSSYDGTPLPIDEMMRWRRDTVDRIAARSPRNLLEIGVGRGLLLAELAGRSDSYWATDISARSISLLTDDIAQRPELAGKVELRVRPADDVTGLPRHHFDMIVLNSVVQYFPSRDYLVDVLRKAFDLLAAGGAVFIGDVRNYDLLDLFSGAVTMARFGGNDGATGLRAKARAASQNERELLISPDLFVRLANTMPGGVADVRIKPHDLGNELSAYRYDVVLSKRMAPPDPNVPGPTMRWGVDVDDHADILASLAGRGLDRLRVSGIPNARLAGDLLRSLALDGNSAPSCGRPPEIESIIRDATRLGYWGAATWSHVGRAEGCLDLLLWTDGRLTAGDLVFDDVAPRPLGECTNAPAIADAGSIRSYLQTRLPHYMVPSAYVRLGAIPLTAHGKLDRRALPAPEDGTVATGRYEAPADEVEAELAAIWSDILSVERVGRLDDFLDLGGHSLSAIRVVSRIRQRFGIELSITDLFGFPTIRELSSCVAFLIEADSAPNRSATAGFAEEGRI